MPTAHCPDQRRMKRMLLRFFVSSLLLVSAGSFLRQPVHAAGNTYYVATDGDDGNPCTQSSPCRTIAQGLTRLHAGDTLYLKAGTYIEAIKSSVQTIPSGTSWSAPVTIAAYPGDTVTLRPGGNVVLLTDPAIQYVIFDGLILDGTNSIGQEAVYIYNGPHHIRFQGGEIKNAPISGVQVTTGGTAPYPDDIQFINLSVHHNGSSLLDHGFYISAPNLLVENCDIYSNFGYGVQIYSGFGRDADNAIIRNNRIYDNPGYGGVTLNHGNNIQFYNNHVYNNASGVAVAYGSPDNTQIDSNTIYGNGGSAIEIGPGVTNSKVQNNIVYNNRYGIIDLGSGTVQSNNWVMP